MKKQKGFIRKIKSFFSNIKFKKNLKKEKQKLYFQSSTTERNIFKTKRNKFKLFKGKIEFENSLIKDIKSHTIFYYIFGIFLLLSTIYVIFFSHIFAIKQINISRNSNIDIGLAEKSLEDFMYKSIFFSYRDDIEKKILNDQPNIKTIQISKVFPDKLSIKLESYPAYFTFYDSGIKYNIISNGILIPSYTKGKEKTIDLYGIDNIRTKNYKKIFRKNFLENAKSIVDKIKNQEKISKVIYYVKERELHIINKNGLYIIFALNEEPEPQIKKYNVFTSQNPELLNEGIVYIDLRVNEKIIYCPSRDKELCDKNLMKYYKKK